MRILTVSNIYPPDFIGGYELHCAQAVDGLRRRGHDVEVLTARSDMNEADAAVHRDLRWHDPPPRRPDMRWEAARARTYIANHRAAARLTKRFDPDLVMAWSPARIGAATLTPAARRGIPVVAFADDWSLVDEWHLTIGRRSVGGRQGAGRKAHAIRAAIRHIGRGLRFDHLVAVSGFIEASFADHGFPARSSSVIHQGARFDPPALDEAPRPPDTVLFVGRIDRVKGVHLALDVLRRLRDDHRRHGVTLTCVGRRSTEDPRYLAELDRQMSEHDLADRVTFTGGLSPTEVFALFQRHRVLLFTSQWEEPGPATTIEALGHGVPVVTTDVGGMPEYVRSGRDGFVVARDDGRAMAEAAERLLGDDELWERIRRTGWTRVKEHFNDERFVDELEMTLGEIHARVSASNAR